MELTGMERGGGGGGGVIELKAINRWDVGSVESSDTYASCATHLFASQGDLTDEAPPHNLYVNPLDEPAPPPFVNVPLSPPLKPHWPTLNKTLSNSSQDSIDDTKVMNEMPRRPSSPWKPRFLQGIYRARTPTPEIKTTPKHRGIKAPFPNLVVSLASLLSKSGSRCSLQTTDSNDGVGSPEPVKKSILKKADGAREETEKLIGGPPEEGQEEHKTDGAPGGLISGTKVPLKAIGPKTGPKPQAQPIKFVGIEESRPLTPLRKSPMNDKNLGSALAHSVGLSAALGHLLDAPTPAYSTPPLTSAPPTSFVYTPLSYTPPTAYTYTPPPSFSYNPPTSFSYNPPTSYTYTPPTSYASTLSLKATPTQRANKLTTQTGFDVPDSQADNRIKEGAELNRANQDDVIRRCANPTCSYNRPAQEGALPPVCLCGNPMDDVTPTNGNKPMRIELKEFGRSGGDQLEEGKDSSPSPTEETKLLTDPSERSNSKVVIIRQSSKETSVAS